MKKTCSIAVAAFAVLFLSNLPQAAGPVGDSRQQTPAQPPQGRPSTLREPQGRPEQGRGATGSGQAGEGQTRGGPGGGRRGALPLDPADRTGFEPIFDGTMKTWDGDPGFWRIENGMIVGETTPANPLKENTFLIWRGAEPADFELKLEVRMSAENSGIQFRSQHLPAGSTQGTRTVAGKWVLTGYQADIDFNNRYTGMIYEERGRGILMERGQAVHVGPDGARRVIAQLQRSPDELKAHIKPGDWNHLHIIARGSTMMNILNGQLMSVLIDDDPKAHAMKGLIGLQLHTGVPMKIEFRNVYLKKL